MTRTTLIALALVFMAGAAAGVGAVLWRGAEGPPQILEARFTLDRPACPPPSTIMPPITRAL